MSSFKGRMCLYTNISIDRFDGINLKSTAYFLSHCHKDHMVGLDEKKFETALLSRPGVFLYCSEITRLLLLADQEYRPLEKSIKALEVGVRCVINVPNDHVERGGCEVAVTPISAGHCPGSVMFLFEGDQGASLYTGDFRWEPNYASTVAAFKESDRIKHIDHMYVDTTFCVPAALHIPSRVECAEATVSVVAKWLERSPLNQVAFFCPARYGYEFLMREIATRLGVKIHVTAGKVWLYEQIPDLSGLFTSDAAAARVHACCPKLRTNSSTVPPCLSRAGTRRTNEDKGSNSYQMLNIRPCAMWFTTQPGRAGLEKLTRASPRGLQRVCYSMHSSYSEVQDLVSYLQPKRIWPNVIPSSDHGPEKVQERLNSFLEKSHPLRPRSTRTKLNGQAKMGDRTLDLVDNGRPRKPLLLFRFASNGSDSSDGCVFDSQGSGKEETTAPGSGAAEGNPVSAHCEPEETDDVNTDQGTESPLCPAAGGEEADSDLHLRLSQDSDTSSQDQEDTQDYGQAQDSVSWNPQTEGTCLAPVSRQAQEQPHNTLEYRESNGDSLKALQDDYNTLHGRDGTEMACPKGAKKMSPCDEHSHSNQNHTHTEHSPECHRDREMCTDKHANTKSDKSTGLDSSASISEEDSDVIDSSPVSQGKKFTSLLKGRMGKTISPSIPCPSRLPQTSGLYQNLSYNTTDKKQDASLGNPSQTQGYLSPTVKRRIPTSPAAELGESLDKTVREEGSSQETQAKRRRLSPVSNKGGAKSRDWANTQEKEVETRPAGREREGEDDDSVDCVCIVPSDSEETDEDSEKLLKPLSKADLSSTRPGLRKKRLEFIDLTKDT